MYQKKYSFLLGFPICCNACFYNMSLWFACYLLFGSLLISDILNSILFILSLPLVNLYKSLSISLIFSKNNSLIDSWFYFWLLVSILSASILRLTISCHLLFLGAICSFIFDCCCCSKALRCLWSCWYVISPIFHVTTESYELSS